MFLSIGFFAMFWVFGNLDYATVFSVAPFINETAITIIGLLLLVGAMAKSAQLGLHTWLPDAMEGHLKIVLVLGVIVCILILDLTIVSDSLILQSRLPPLIAIRPKEWLETITGCMLGDGNISYGNRSRDKKQGKIGPSTGNCRYSMTIDNYSYNYLCSLYKNIFS